jgi:lysophospholipase L1-like esterase
VACVILPLGDSITDGFTVPGGYRTELFRKARADGKSITFMGSQANGPRTLDGADFPRRHEGHSGITIDELRFDWVPSPGTRDIPDIVLLMIGTNDVYGRLHLADAPRRLAALVDRMMSAYPEALVALATLTPMGDEISALPVESYNAAIRTLVEQRAAAGQRIILVDMYNGFPPDGLDDVVHPNATGYRHMAGVWYAAIRERLR